MITIATLIVDDGEALALEAAIDSYVAICNRELAASGPKAPFWAHRNSLRALRARLLDHVAVCSAHQPGVITLRD